MFVVFWSSPLEEMFWLSKLQILQRFCSYGGAPAGQAHTRIHALAYPTTLPPRPTLPRPQPRRRCSPLLSLPPSLAARAPNERPPVLADVLLLGFFGFFFFNM